MKIGFIGMGNMAKALISGMLSDKRIQPCDIIGSAKTEETKFFCRERFGISTGDNREVAACSDILFLAIKPQMISCVLNEIKDVLNNETMVVSIAAGVSMNQLEEGLGKDMKLIRCMPNTPVLVREGCIAVVRGKCVEEHEWQELLGLLSCCGLVKEVREELMDAVVGISGSSPAYVFLFIEAMADAGVLAGLPRKTAYEMAAQSVLGSAKMVLETGKHPGELKDMVCSPGGTTIEAVKVLEQEGMRGAVMDAMEACIEKSRNLTRKK